MCSPSPDRTQRSSSYIADACAQRCSKDVAVTFYERLCKTEVAGPERSLVSFGTFSTAAHGPVAIWRFHMRKLVSTCLFVVSAIFVWAASQGEVAADVATSAVSSDVIPPESVPEPIT